MFYLLASLFMGVSDICVRQIDSFKNSSGYIWPAQSRRNRSDGQRISVPLRRIRYGWNIIPHRHRRTKGNLRLIIFHHNFERKRKSNLIHVHFRENFFQIFEKYSVFCCCFHWILTFSSGCLELTVEVICVTFYTKWIEDR